MYRIVKRTHAANLRLLAAWGLPFLSASPPSPFDASPSLTTTAIRVRSNSAPVHTKRSRFEADPLLPFQTSPLPSPRFAACPLLPVHSIRFPDRARTILATPIASVARQCCRSERIRSMPGLSTSFDSIPVLPVDADAFPNLAHPFRCCRSTRRRLRAGRIPFGYCQAGRLRSHRIQRDAHPRTFASLPLLPLLSAPIATIPRRSIPIGCCRSLRYRTLPLEAIRVLLGPLLPCPSKSFDSFPIAAVTAVPVASGRSAAGPIRASRFLYCHSVTPRAPTVRSLPEPTYRLLPCRFGPSFPELAFPLLPFYRSSSLRVRPAARTTAFEAVHRGSSPLPGTEPRERANQHVARNVDHRLTK